MEHAALVKPRIYLNISFYIIDSGFIIIFLNSLSSLDIIILSDE